MKTLLILLFLGSAAAPLTAQPATFRVPTTDVVPGFQLTPFAVDTFVVELTALPPY